MLNNNYTKKQLIPHAIHKLKPFIKKYFPHFIVLIRKLQRFAKFIIHFVFSYKIPLLVVSIGHMCNLKCRDCANLSPWSSKSEKKYSIHETIEDLKIVTKASKGIKLLHIQGGEPFLFSDLDLLLNSVDKSVEKILIATNGTIIPSASTVKAIVDHKALVRVSNYHVEGYEDKTKELFEVLEKAGIEYSVYSFTKDCDKWCNLGGRETSRKSNSNQVLNQYKACFFKECLTMENGLIGTCSRSIVAQKIQGFDYIENDYINVRKSKNAFLLRFSIFWFSYKMKVFECCRHCNGTDSALVDPAIQL